MSTFSFGQTRLNLTSGFGSILEPGFYYHNNSNISFVTDISDNFSLSFGANLMTPRKKHEKGNFTYCDSFTYSGGWQNRCVDGYDSTVSSAYYYAYKKTEISVHALWRRGKDNQNLTGVGITGVFFNRQRFIDDPLFEDDKIETGSGIAVTVKHIYRFPILKPESGMHLILNLDGGLLYSPQYVCDDANCDNFFERYINLTCNVVIGLSFDLN